LPESFRGGCSFGAGVPAGLSRASSWAEDTFARHGDGVKGLASWRHLVRGRADTRFDFVSGGADAACLQE